MGITRVAVILHALAGLGAPCDLLSGELACASEAELLATNATAEVRVVRLGVVGGLPLADWGLGRFRPPLRALSLPADAFAAPGLLRGMRTERLPSIHLRSLDDAKQLGWQSVSGYSGRYRHGGAGFRLSLESNRTIACDCTSLWLHHLEDSLAQDSTIRVAGSANEEKKDSDVAHFLLPSLLPHSPRPCTAAQVVALDARCRRPALRFPAPEGVWSGNASRSLTCSMALDEAPTTGALSLRSVSGEDRLPTPTRRWEPVGGGRFQERLRLPSLSPGHLGWALCESWPAAYPAYILRPIVVKAPPLVRPPEPQETRLSNSGDIHHLRIPFTITGFPLPKSDRFNYTLNGGEPKMMGRELLHHVEQHFYKATVTARLMILNANQWKLIVGQHELRVMNNDNVTVVASGVFILNETQAQAYIKAAHIRNSDDVIQRLFHKRQVSPVSHTGLMFPLLTGTLCLLLLLISSAAGLFWLRARKGRRSLRLEKALEEAVPLQENSTYMTVMSEAVPLIDYELLDVVRELGEGAFGAVFLATCRDPLVMAAAAVASSESEYQCPLSRKVAVKTLKHVSQDQVRQFINEAELLVELSHPNVVSFFGVAQDGADLLLVFEYMELGDLKTYLRQSGPQSHLLCGENPPAGHKRGVLPPSEQVNLCIQIAKGLAYLEKKKVLHRDLAARNCLLSNVKTPPLLKLSDFGMSRAICSSDYYRINHTKAALPVRWLPPESLSFGTFSKESDIWSFGVTMWEILSFGMLPYGHLSNSEVVELTTRHQISLPRPPNSSPALYALLKSACSYHPSERPTVGQIEDTLRKILLQETPLRNSWAPLGSRAPAASFDVPSTREEGAAFHSAAHAGPAQPPARC